MSVYTAQNDNLREFFRLFNASIGNLSLVTLLLNTKPLIWAKACITVTSTVQITESSLLFSGQFAFVDQSGPACLRLD